MEPLARRLRSQKPGSDGSVRRRGEPGTGLRQQASHIPVGGGPKRQLARLHYALPHHSLWRIPSSGPSRCGARAETNNCVGWAAGRRLTRAWGFPSADPADPGVVQN